jgi:hypothetical protein
LTDLNFIFSFHLWAATESISVMNMLAEQAEKNLTLAVIAADTPGAVTEHEYEDEVHDQYGESHPHKLTYYSCGSSAGYDYDEVKSEYKVLITQLTRRSAFLTMFGLFEHRMSKCLTFMVQLTKCEEGEIKGKGPIEKVHIILKKFIGGKGVADVDHLTKIRNIMIHDDGVATGYKEIRSKNGKKPSAEKRLLRAISRAEGVSVNHFDGVLMDGKFLMYAVSEFNRYITSLEAAIQIYHKEQASERDRSNK